MVRKISDNGGIYHEPPYTFEEEMEIYRDMCAGPLTILHRPAAAAPAPPQKLPQQLPEE